MDPFFRAVRERRLAAYVAANDCLTRYPEWTDECMFFTRDDLVEMMTHGHRLRGMTYTMLVFYLINWADDPDTHTSWKKFVTARSVLPSKFVRSFEARQSAGQYVEWIEAGLFPMGDPDFVEGARACAASAGIYRGHEAPKRLAKLLK